MVIAKRSLLNELIHMRSSDSVNNKPNVCVCVCAFGVMKQLAFDSISNDKFIHKGMNNIKKKWKKNKCGDNNEWQ